MKFSDSVKSCPVGRHKQHLYNVILKKSAMKLEQKVTTYLI